MHDYDRKRKGSHNFRKHGRSNKELKRIYYSSKVSTPYMTIYVFLFFSFPGIATYFKQCSVDRTMLLQKAKALKLKYFGHIKRHETLERHILEARIDGRRGRGRPTRRWEQDINDWMDMTTTQAGRLAEDRILFRQKVQEATSRQEIS